MRGIMPMAEKFYQLTNPQKSIWTQEEFFEGTTINNICASITILDTLNETALKKAVHFMVQHNDNFKIRIILKDHSPMQYFAEATSFPIETIYLKKESDIEKIKEDLMNYQYHILDSNLFCFKIAKFPDGHGMLIFTVHHIISDGWSLGIFAQNIMEKYREFCTGDRLYHVSLPELHQYREFLEGEQNYLQSFKFENDKAYWLRQFQEIPELVSFTSTKKSLKNDFVSKRESFRVPFPFAQNIQKYCQENKISVFQFFMAIYSIYLSKTSELNEFTIRNTYFKPYQF